MLAHLYLLIIIFTNHRQELTSWVELRDGTKAAAQDIKQGKLVVRLLHNNATLDTDVRKKIEQLTMPQMLQYDIGLSTASTRTAKQTQLARQYTDHVIKNSVETYSSMAPSTPNTIEHQ